jgi:hypothetical protein
MGLTAVITIDVVSALRVGSGGQIAIFVEGLGRPRFICFHLFFFYNFRLEFCYYNSEIIDGDAMIGSRITVDILETRYPRIVQRLYFEPNKAYYDVFLTGLKRAAAWAPSFVWPFVP